MKIELLTPLETFHSFHHQIQTTRKRNISVKRQDLLNFLIDHSKLICAVEDCTTATIVEPKAPRKRVRLTARLKRRSKKRTRL